MKKEDFDWKKNEEVHSVFHAIGVVGYFAGLFAVGWIIGTVIAEAIAEA